MKIIVLNSQLHDSSLVRALQRAGIAVIVCDTVHEADLALKLHGRSISLYLGYNDLGVAFSKNLKEGVEFAHLPTLLVHATWTPQQCAQHQQSALSANAYLKTDFSPKKLLETINQVLGTHLNTEIELTQAAVPLSEATHGTDLSSPVAEAEGLTLNLTQAVDEVNAASDEPILDLGNIFTPTTGEEVQGPIEIALDLTRVQTGVPTVDPAMMADSTTASENEVFATRMMSSSEIEEGNDSSDEVLEPLGEDSIETPLSSFKVQEEAQSGARVETELDDDALREMPYLAKRSFQPSPMAYQQPLNDAIIPGGAAEAPDSETLKKYLLLREQDVAALSQQLQRSKDQIAYLEEQLKQEKAMNTEFAHLAQEQGKRIDQFEAEKGLALESFQKEIDELQFEMKKKMDKVRLMELKVKEATEETEQIKERVRLDIRKIRTREKELENRLEIMRKDSEALLMTREQKIIELKRKLDLLEFNSDLIQNQYEKEKENSALLREKLLKAAQVVRVAGGLLHPEDQEGIAEPSPQFEKPENKTSVA